MKTRSTIASSVMILILAALVMGFMIEFAKAQSTASSGNQNNQAQVLQVNMPQRGLRNRILDNTSLGYYQLFSGPTASGNTSETYNVFQDGRAPLQSFHSVNLRHQFNADWAFGVSLAMTNTYTDEVTNRPTKEAPQGTVNSPGDIWYNARAYLGLPSFKIKAGTFFTTVSYEAPTSVISRNDNMRFGYILSENFAINTGSVRWSTGVMGQAYRMVYENNIKAPPFPGGRPTALQTMIVSAGPWVTYRFNDKWMAGSSLTFDWDQRGDQTNTTKFNNNLPDRGRVGVTYFPSIKHFSSIGVFAQSLLQVRAESTMFGGEFALRF
jgi:hypothetical protein